MGTEPEMKLRQGDTARVAFPSLLETGEIQILRESQGAAELALGSTIPVAAQPERILSPAKMKLIEGAVGSVIEAAAGSVQGSAK